MVLCTLGPSKNYLQRAKKGGEAQRHDFPSVNLTFS